jgi:hypothetical protein
MGTVTLGRGDAVDEAAKGFDGVQMFVVRTLV